MTTPIRARRPLFAAGAAALVVVVAALAVVLLGNGSGGGGGDDGALAVVAPGEERALHLGGAEVVVVDEPGADAAAPVVVLLHGRGGNPRNMLPLLRGIGGAPVRVASIKAPLPFGVGTQWFVWPPGTSEADLAQRVDDAAAKVWPTIAALARGRRALVVAGFSQGAVLTYTLACRHQNDIALAVPVSGRATAGLGTTCAPIVALHGTDDDVLPLSFDRESVASLMRGGARAELREYPGVRHHISDAMAGDLRAAVAGALQKP